MAPASSESTLTLGTLPGGGILTGTVVRTRSPDDNNVDSLPETSGTLESNPANMEVWKLHSHLLYTINGKQYVKSRTVVRTR